MRPYNSRPRPRKHYFRQQIGNFWPFFGRKLFFFLLAALQAPICCCNTTANTFQWVRPRPRRSSITKCIMNTKENTVFGKTLAIHGHFGAKTVFFVLAALQPPICCCNTTANTFEWLSPTPAVVNHKMHNENEKEHCFRQKIGNFWAKNDSFCAGGPASADILLQYNCKHVSVGPSPTPAVVNHKVHIEYQKKHCFPQKMAIHGHFCAETVFLCAGGPATPDMLLQYNCKHVSVDPSPTPAVFNDPTKRSCIGIQGTTNGNENKGRLQQAAPL